jgi:hypothetical protein
VALGPVRLFSHLSAAPTLADWFYRFLVVFGMVVSVLLVIRTAYALEALKAYFLFSFLLNGIVFLHDMWGGRGILDESSTAFTTRPLSGVVVTVTWFLYFRNSLRVKATYGRNI